MARPSNLTRNVSYCPVIVAAAQLERSSSWKGFVLDIVHGGNSLLRIILLGVADKSEATAAAGIAILDHNLYAKMQSEIYSLQPCSKSNMRIRGLCLG